MYFHIFEMLSILLDHYFFKFHQHYGTYIKKKGRMSLQNIFKSQLRLKSQLKGKLF